MPVISGEEDAAESLPWQRSGQPVAPGEGRTAPPSRPLAGLPWQRARSGKGHWCPNSCSASIKMLPELATFDPSDSGTYGLNGAQRCHWLGFIIPVCFTFRVGGKTKTKKRGICENTHTFILSTTSQVKQQRFIIVYLRNTNV